MKINAYAILDSKSKTYSKPFYFIHDGEALRAFRGSIQKGDTQISQFPEDFSLYKIGVFDDQSGQMKTEKIEYIGKAVDYTSKNGAMKK